MRLGTRMFSSVNTKSIVFGGVIILACVAFIFTGFGSLHIGNLNSMDPGTAAKVGPLSVSMNELVNNINQRGYGSATGPEKKYVAAQILKQLISQKIMANEALKIGWQVSDNEIASSIKAVPLFQDETTHQFNLSYFKNYIANQQTSEIDFYNYLRNQLNIQNMDNLLFMPAVFSNAVVQNQYEINNTQFHLQYAILNLPENTLRKKVETAAKAFADNKANLKSLQDLYATQKDQYNQKAKTKVRSILIAYKGANRAQGEALNRSKEDALKLIQSTLSQIQKGKDFSQLAVLTNDDATAKANKGDLGFVDDSSIDTASLSAITQLSVKKTLSDVVDTPFGFRLFQYEDAKPAVHKNFEDVKLELAKQITGSQVKTDTENQFQVDLSSALSSQNITKINTLLAQNGISWQYLAKPFQVSQNEIPELGQTTNLAEQIFSLKKSGDIISKIIDFGTKKAVLKLNSIEAPSKPTDDDLNTLRKQMASEQSQLFAQKLDQELTKEYEKEEKIKINPVMNEQ